MNQMDNDGKMISFPFSSFNEKEKNRLIANNFEKLGLHIINWKENFESLELTISQFIEEFGFSKLYYIIDGDRKFHLNSTVVVENILYTIDVLLKVEKHNKEIYTMLQKAKESYELIINNTEDTFFILIIDEDTSEVIIEEYVELIDYTGREQEELNEITEFFKENTNYLEIFKLIKKIELANLYGSNSNNKDLVTASTLFITEKKKEMNDFKDYVNKKIKVIQEKIASSNAYVGSFQHLKDYLNEHDDVLFDINGKLVS
jgi:hypothetical protein